jgi:hypothetical protein
MVDDSKFTMHLSKTGFMLQNHLKATPGFAVFIVVEMLSSPNVDVVNRLFHRKAPFPQECSLIRHVAENIRLNIIAGPPAADDAMLPDQ